MFTSSRSAATSLLVVALAAPLADAESSTAPPLPEAVGRLAPLARAQGGGEVRFLGLAVYDGWYWSPVRGYSIDAPFALDLHYRRALSGERIAQRSADEIAKLGRATSDELARWGAAMKAVFPDVADGDRVTGVNLPGRGAAFFLNGKPIGVVPDPAFARAFFGIWFDPATSQPDFRKQLLGER